MRAKFTVMNAEINGATENVVMMPVAGEGAEENKAFWNATPAGRITMSITNPDAHGQLEQGKSYYVDFTPADS